MVFVLMSLVFSFNMMIYNPINFDFAVYDRIPLLFVEVKHLIMYMDHVSLCATKADFCKFILVKSAAVKNKDVGNVALIPLRC